MHWPLIAVEWSITSSHDISDPFWQKFLRSFFLTKEWWAQWSWLVSMRKQVLESVLAQGLNNEKLPDKLHAMHSKE